MMHVVCCTWIVCLYQFGKFFPTAIIASTELCVVSLAFWMVFKYLWVNLLFSLQNNTKCVVAFKENIRHEMANIFSPKRYKQRWKNAEKTTICAISYSTSEKKKYIVQNTRKILSQQLVWVFFLNNYLKIYPKA